MQYVTIHGHFYQPYRANPWTGAIDEEESAVPYHDWNERVAAECYAPNARARVLGPDGAVLAEADNYERLSFDFGPTLLEWLERYQPDTYRAIVEADRVGRSRYSGHGPAIAQMYNHTIAPLDADRDKRTQALWGIRDFERRFGRRPEGMWLAEAAVDVATLEVLAELGVGFTILAPHQAGAVRHAGEEQWHEADRGIDTPVAYSCRLPSGQSISLFFYDGAVAHGAAFGGLLRDGRQLAERLAGVWDKVRGAGLEPDSQALVPSTLCPAPPTALRHIALDGETFGHHHKFGEMALATCLAHVQSLGGRLTVYGEFLALHPPESEVRLAANTSWSCSHGVERWRSDCGCNSGVHPGWNQAWRAPLRRAVDWLTDRLAGVFDERGRPLLADPWQARDDYISVILDDRLENTVKFMREHGALGRRQQDEAGTLLEMERFILLTRSSDAWFFDDISDITAIQCLRCCRRALELCRDAGGPDLEPDFAAMLEAARSNVPELGTGRDIFERFAGRHY